MSPQSEEGKEYRWKGEGERKKLKSFSNKFEGVTKAKTTKQTNEEMESNWQTKMIEAMKTYTADVVGQLSAKYKFDAVEALAYVRRTAEEVASAAEPSVAEASVAEATESTPAVRGRPEKKGKKVVNKGEMVAETITEILTAEVVVAPKKKVTKKKADAPAVVVAEPEAAVVVAVAEVPVPEVAAPKKKITNNKADAPGVVVAEPVAVVVAEPEVVVAEVIAPKKKVTKKKAAAPEVVAEPEVVVAAPEVAEVLAEVTAPKKKVTKKKEAEPKEKAEPKKEVKRKPAAKKAAAVVEPEPAKELIEEELKTEAEDSDEEESEVTVEDWEDADGTIYYLVRENGDLLLDYQSQTPVGRLVNGKKVDAEFE